jgi:hypothetical protein
MNKPFPTEEQVNRFIGTLTALGGKAGNGPMMRKLNWSEEDYNWIKDNLLAEGIIRTGRGRGGSIALTNVASHDTTGTTEETEEQPVAQLKKTPNKKEPEEETPLEEINVEEVKARYKPLPNTLESFKPGMRVVRPRFDLYPGDNAWLHLKHYIVDKIEREQVFVKVAQIKNSESYAARPIGFYQRA